MPEAGSSVRLARLLGRLCLPAARSYPLCFQHTPMITNPQIPFALHDLMRQLGITLCSFVFLGC